ncbi:hypothetical protein CLV62_1126 [Dysgonomonas alginatilytica]|uniref:Uncharacterized protein n=1 Tax=Dysgonomonas alginatilytica TaxID=1605892 RepID=A0A2V3PPW8_9BACT|nr:hypothetical protein [Dysgonomonas alginatilytica]PXV63757.1 hypothetical protein CLV62_1126 [Dysgonomonas alginatilytica]
MNNQEYKDKILVIESSKPYYFRKIFANYIDDEKMITELIKFPIERIINIVLALGVTILGIWAIIRSSEKWRLEEIILTFFIGIIVVSCIIIIINNILNTDRKFIFNRENGTLTMRATVLNWIPRTITIPFEDARIGVSGTPLAQSIGVMISGNKFWHIKITAIQDSTDWTNCMSFLVWYMDRNRPLPPGEDLDAYRQKDYERRKAEGFLKPLYKSTISMTDVDGDTQRYRSNVN